MWNILLSLSELRDIDWQSVITAVLTSTTFSALAIWGLKKLLQRLVARSLEISTTSQKVSNEVEKNTTAQTSLISTLNQVKVVTTQMIESDAELKELYTQGTIILQDKLKLITDLREVLEKYREEE